MHIDATYKVLIVFAAVLTATRLRLPLGLALIGGGIALTLWAGRIALLGGDLQAALFDINLWLFVLNIALIMEFGVFMTEGDNAQALISSIHGWAGRHGRAFSIVLLPATLGLVPMPGGAIFSAPLLGKSVEGRNLSPDWKAAANYWFRHINEYWWPLCPVAIVTLSIMPLEAWRLISLQLPFTFAHILAGALFIIVPQHIKLRMEDREIETRPGGLKLLIPIATVVASIMILPQLIEKLLPAVPSSSAKLLGMTIGLLSGLAIIAHQRGSIPLRAACGRLFSLKHLNILLTVAGVMIFKSMLEMSGLIITASEEMAARDLPIILIIALLPFLAGLVTGIAIGFAGPTFPLVIGLVEAGGHDLTIASALPLAFGMGYVGMMMSPVHPCLLLSKEYFQASLFSTYRHLAPCSIFIVVASIALHILYRSLGW